MFRRFLRDRRGNVAMMFGLAAVPLIAATGAAIDFSRAYEQRMVVQDAMDSAALAAARLVGIASEEEVIAEARAFFRTQTSGRLSEDVEITVVIDGTSVRVTTNLRVPTSLLNIVGIDDINFNLLSRTEAGGRNVEVALVLDITQSMCTPNCTALNALKVAATNLVNLVVQEEQEPFYSKVALIPYSMGVNVGSYANTVRGSYTSPVTITGYSWAGGSALNITGISNQNPARVTASSHGLQTGDVVYLEGISGSGSKGMGTNLNGKWFTVTRISSSVFSLNGVNSTSWNSYSSSSNDYATKCQTASCEIVVTESASGTPYATGATIFLWGVEINESSSSLRSMINNNFTVGATTSTTFVLSGTVGPNFGTYRRYGQACFQTGCEYFRFMDANNDPQVHRISSCASERVVAGQQYTDAPPSEALVGRLYPAGSGLSSCPSAQIVPLTTNAADINSRISQLSTSGSTAGHIGIAWGWYTLAPEWAEVWPAASDPAAYDAPETLKVAVIMTDGQFNTAYCDGVIAKNTAQGIISNSQRINCNATNGDPFTQAERLCDAMKAVGITVYTVGFNVGNAQDVVDLMNTCSSGASYTYLAASPSQLSTAFEAIGNDIRRLRIAE